MFKYSANALAVMPLRKFFNRIINSLTVLEDYLKM